MEEQFIEIWKDIPEWEGMYQMSNLGKIKSLERKVFYKDGRIGTYKEVLFNPTLGKNGYLYTTLSNGKTRKYITIHQLMAITFLNHIPCKFEVVIDHIDENKLNNNLSNLQLITNRNNCIRSKKHKYIGARKRKNKNGFFSVIKIQNIIIYLGVFENEILASEFYKKAVENIEKYNGVPKDFRDLIKSLVD